MVEVVYGRPDDADEIVSPAYVVLTRGDTLPPGDTPDPMGPEPPESQPSRARS
jgi:hypothetical protein